MLSGEDTDDVDILLDDDGDENDGLEEGLPDIETLELAGLGTTSSFKTSMVVLEAELDEDLLPELVDNVDDVDNVEFE